MRNHIISFLLFVFFFSATANAQEEFTPYSTFGIKAGTNFAKTRFDPVVEQNFKQGYVGGIVFKYFSQKIMGIQLELNYMQGGWKDTLKYERTLNYLQLPVMTHAEFGWEKTKILINFGPAFSYLISEDEKKFAEETEENAYCGEELDRKFYFGACFGIGALRKTKVGEFQLEGRVNFNLNNNFSGEIEESFSASQSYNIEVCLSYFLPPKKIVSKNIDNF